MTAIMLAACDLPAPRTSSGSDPATGDTWGVDSGETGSATPTLPHPEWLSAGDADIILEGLEDVDLFGSGVAIGPDLDGDQRRDLFVGAPLGGQWAGTGTEGVGYLAGIGSATGDRRLVLGSVNPPGNTVGYRVASHGNIVATGTIYNATYFMHGDDVWQDAEQIVTWAAGGVLDEVGDELELGDDMDGNGSGEVVGVIGLAAVHVYDLDIVSIGVHSWEESWLVVLRDGPDGQLEFPISVAPPSDLDGDSLTDLIFARAPASTAASVTYVEYAPSPGTMSILDTDVRLEGTVDDWSQRNGAVGDLDLDGLPDLAVGAPHWGANGGDGEVGRAYVWLGAPQGTQKLWDAPIRIDGEFGDDNEDEVGFGMAVAPAGDTDGDGDDDFLVSAMANATSVWLVHGPLAPGRYDVEDLASMRVLPEPNGRYIGWEMEPLGDYDGDGTDDFALGGPALIGGPPGAVYVFLGPR